MATRRTPNEDTTMTTSTRPTAPAPASTFTRTDVEWTLTGEKPCTCGHCLVCEVEALAVPVDSAAEIDAEVMACAFDDDPSPYAGTYSDE